LVEGASISKAVAAGGDFADPKVKIRFSEGTPNIHARDDINITDAAPIVRAVDGERDAGDLVQRRWSWPGQNQKPVYKLPDHR
jgi:putative SOS response-associated peptidase YedK